MDLTAAAVVVVAVDGLVRSDHCYVVVDATVDVH